MPGALLCRARGMPVLDSDRCRRLILTLTPVGLGIPPARGCSFPAGSLATGGGRGFHPRAPGQLGWRCSTFRVCIGCFPPARPLPEGQDGERGFDFPQLFRQPLGLLHHLHRLLPVQGQGCLHYDHTTEVPDRPITGKCHNCQGVAVEVVHYICMAESQCAGRNALGDVS